MRIPNWLKRLFGWYEPEGQLRIGMRIGFTSVSEIGPTEGFGGLVVPVKLMDGTYAILSVDPSKSKASVRRWSTDNPEAAIALCRSITMPSVNKGIGQDTIQVWGEDLEGPFCIKLFCNYRKHDCGWPDEFHRLELKK